MAYYIGLIHKEKKSGFGVLFPDFPGCTTVGKTLDEAHKLARGALEFHIEGMIEDGERIPEPSTLEEAVASDLAKGHVAAILVHANTGGKTVRFNVCFAGGLLERIDEQTHNRSAWLAEAAKKMLAEKR